jgi:predicted nucleotidyltransferase
MKTKDQILMFLSQNKKLFRDKYHIIRIGLFGSYARGEQNIDSDIDLLVEFEDNTQELYDLKLQLKDFFLKTLGVEIDICREKYIKPRIKKQILKETVYVD